MYSGVRVPAAPFQAWLQRLLAEEAASGVSGVRQRVADRVDVTVRNLSKWLKAETMDEHTVDRALTAEGSIMLSDLYDGTWEALLPRKRPERTVCATPGCEEPVAVRHFCDEHAAVLAGVRAAMAAEDRQFRTTIKRPHARPTCCAPGCLNPRLAAEAYCDACTDAGWIEEDDR
jgi:hypothetical protein